MYYHKPMSTDAHEPSTLESFLTELLLLSPSFASLGTYNPEAISNFRNSTMSIVGVGGRRSRRASPPTSRPGSKSGHTPPAS